MPYKYSDDITTVKELQGKSCFSDYREENLTAYRWIFDDSNDQRNFTPLALNPNASSSRRRCSGWALSFHLTEEASVAAWEFFAQSRPNVHKKIGTQIAICDITTGDGKRSEADDYNHFNLIEYRNADFTNRFTPIRRLIEENHENR